MYILTYELISISGCQNLEFCDNMHTRKENGFLDRRQKYSTILYPEIKVIHIDYEPVTTEKLIQYFHCGK